MPHVAPPDTYLVGEWDRVFSEGTVVIRGEVFHISGDCATDGSDLPGYVLDTVDSLFDEMDEAEYQAGCISAGTWR